ncbi:unnamed protein product, partial [Mesorhabditis belari]|uniref:MYND-type domain-containing protein n=1 Tax=Mesorhabditis belari TaxID=2138241 RepID=A0AAF3FMU1_9BILA
MTPLCQAAFRGNVEMARVCLKFGAEVNTKRHEQGYTPLMFAALSGKPDLCRLLMDYGAESSYTNNIGKTACELAAFVGQHECVSVINNHISLEQINKLLNPKDSEEKFPEELSKFIHKTVSAHVVHPIAIIFTLLDYEDALKYRKKILYVVDRIFESQLRCKESNEVLSLKVWIILQILRETYKFIDERKDQENPLKSATFYAKSLLFMSPGDEVRPKLDTLLRSAIVSFPYHHSLLFETLVKALSKSKFGQRPAGYDYIVQGLFGQRLHAVSHFCFTCGSFSAKKRCGGCKVPYCSEKCQKFDWPIHKRCCQAISDWNKKDEEEEIDLDQIKASIEEVDEIKASVEEVDEIKASVEEVDEDGETKNE